ncbi:MAG: 30S ribosomal protein S12 methylthiotransferase RimO [Planctomycetes bacterium]|nr:30S ribosomal protein S12 methylthiotransferase RimO [Planctomycetota bacterium]
MTASDDSIRSVAFVSLGCPKNLVDSEKMLGVLAAGGIKLVSDHDAADAIVINTCGFLEASKDESLEVIQEALERKRAGTVKRVVVAGCLVQRHRAKMLEWAPGIDAMIGVFDRDHIMDAVSGRAAREANAGPGTAGTDAPRYWIAGNALQAAAERGIATTGLTVNGKDGKGIGYFEDDSNRFRLTPRHWAYLRVSEGCNQRCAFCTIPSIRGKMRSKPVETIVSEARALLADGAFELNLIGQDTTSFGNDIGYNEGLVGMLRAVDGAVREHGAGWARLMYAYPSNFTDEMIDAMASLDNVVKYIDMPLQHMSDSMLTSMRRHTSKRQQAELLEKLRERMPGIAIRTTFITGFPGETQADHEELLEFVQEFGFDAMGVFKYSPEDGTPAGTMDADPALHVPDEVKAERERELMLAQQEVAFENAAYQAEQRVQFDVLVDGPAAGATAGRATPGVSEGGILHVGRCYHQAPQIDALTYVLSREKLAPGELVRCTVVGSDGYDLVVQPTSDIERKVILPVIRS